MNKLTKMELMLGGVMLVIVLFSLNPHILGKIFKSLIGKTTVLAMIIFLSMNNVALGISATLAVILSLSVSRSSMEGFTDASGNMDSIDLSKAVDASANLLPLSNPASTSSSAMAPLPTIVITPPPETQATPVPDTATAAPSTSPGVDKIGIEQQFRGTSSVSNSLPIMPVASTADVAPTSKESFTSMFSGAKW